MSRLLDRFNKGKLNLTAVEGKDVPLTQEQANHILEAKLPAKKGTSHATPLSFAIDGGVVIGAAVERVEQAKTAEGEKLQTLAERLQEQRAAAPKAEATTPVLTALQKIQARAKAKLSPVEEILSTQVKVALPAPISKLAQILANRRAATKPSELIKSVEQVSRAAPNAPTTPISTPSVAPIKVVMPSIQEFTLLSPQAVSVLSPLLKIIYQGKLKKHLASQPTVATVEKILEEKADFIVQIEEVELTPLQRMLAKQKPDVQVVPKAKPETVASLLEEHFSKPDKGGTMWLKPKAKPEASTLHQLANVNHPVSDKPDPSQGTVSFHKTEEEVEAMTPLQRMMYNSALKKWEDHKAKSIPKADAPTYTVEKPFLQASAATDGYFGKKPTPKLKRSEVELPVILIKDGGNPSPAATVATITNANESRSDDPNARVDFTSAKVPYNEPQLLAIETVTNGESCVIWGKAGTGKTTTVKGIIFSLLENSLIQKNQSYKVQDGGSIMNRSENQWSIALCAYSSPAVVNLRTSITSVPQLSDFYDCVQTIHNLLEFIPVYTDELDPVTLQTRTTMRFEPQRDANHPLDIDILVIEESSQVDLTLAGKLMDALPAKCQVIYLGDINQLPPMCGVPILAYAAAKLTCIELTHVYRTKLGVVLNNAHAVLEGKMLTEGTDDTGFFALYHDYLNDKNQRSLKKHSRDVGRPVQCSMEQSMVIYKQVFKLFHERGTYDPEQDMILTAWNKKGVGSEDINREVSQFLGDLREAKVYEVLTGMRKIYLAEGDRILYNKVPYVITTINVNMNYVGREPQRASTALTRSGVLVIGKEAASAGANESFDEQMDDYANMDILSLSLSEEDISRRACSHVITIKAVNGGQELSLDSSGDLKLESFTLGYCMTTHKSQGQEFRNTFIIVHQKHASQLSREWIYTGITRTRESCTLIGHEATIKKAIARQSIRGNTVEEKMLSFCKGKSPEDLAITPVTPKERNALKAQRIQSEADHGS